VYSRGLVLALPGEGVLMDAQLNHMLNLFGLTSGQRLAVSERARNTIVTAGAGSGKTRTLVARYLGLLSEGLQPRQVVAVTFTEKTAREMRSRTRTLLHQVLHQAGSPQNNKDGWGSMPRWTASGSAPFTR
jgi:superfamily I DNA and RNA helicase